LGERWRAGFVILTAFVVAFAAGAVIFTRPSQAEPVYTPRMTPSATPILVTPSPVPLISVVAFGDSITGGCSLDGCGKPWVSLLAVDRPDMAIGNAGVGGNTTAMMLARVDTVVAAHPALVLLMGGTNDSGSPEETAANLQAIVETLKASGAAVVVLTIPPRSGMGTAEGIGARNAAIKSMAASEGVSLIDIYPSLAQADGTYKPDLTVDGTHPNAAGNVVIEGVVLPALVRLGY
jgi:lysophospholipase L1-like esterase